jgi:hypothetical protein
MARTSRRLPNRFPVGSTYVVEARGSVRGMTLMHRYVQFPDGRRIELAARLVQACAKTGATAVRSMKSAAVRARSRVQAPTAAVAE